MAPVNTKPGGRIDAVLVCGGRYHDFDYARLELLDEVGRFDRVRTRVFEDFACAREGGALTAADVLVTYTCDVRPTHAEQRGLWTFVAGGGRWLALHATNSALDAPPRLDTGEPFRTPPAFPLMAEVVGSQFLAHPPIQPYRVEITDPDHPLVAGISSFTVDDELYCSAIHGPLEVLLHTRFRGRCPGFEAADWPQDDARPVLYLKRTGAGTVCYFTLGHCRSALDMQAFMAEYPRVERGAWEVPEYRTLLSRCLAWAVTGREAGRDAGRDTRVGHAVH
jgi:type 1 glutamine amidotransferase